MNTVISNSPERKKTKRFAWIITVIYLILFPFLFMLAVASVMVFDRPNTFIPFGLALICMYFLIPLSIPLTFYLVWSRYSKGDFKKSLQFCWIPVYVVGIVICCFALMDAMGA